jgi:hypothetical protein
MGSRQSGQANEREIRASTLITVLSKRKRIHGGPIVRSINERNGDLSPAMSPWGILREVFWGQVG